MLSDDLNYRMTILEFRSLEVITYPILKHFLIVLGFVNQMLGVSVLPEFRKTKAGKFSR